MSSDLNLQPIHLIGEGRKTYSIYYDLAELRLDA